MDTTAFNKRILEAFELTNADEQTQQKILDLAQEFVMTTTIACIVEKLGATEEKEHFFSLLGSDETGKQAIAYAEQQIPNLQKDLAVEIEKALEDMQKENHNT